MTSHDFICNFLKLIPETPPIKEDPTKEVPETSAGKKKTDAKSIKYIIDNETVRTLANAVDTTNDG